MYNTCLCIVLERVPIFTDSFVIHCQLRARAHHTAKLPQWSSSSPCIILKVCGSTVVQETQHNPFFLLPPPPGKQIAFPSVELVPNGRVAQNAGSQLQCQLLELWWPLTKPRLTQQNAISYPKLCVLLVCLCVCLSVAEILSPKCLYNLNLPHIHLYTVAHSLFC